MKISGIYKITNKINNKVYIGQSKDIGRRYKEHFNHIHKYDVKSVYYDMNIYGIENFNFEIILETYDLDYWERKFICWYRSNDFNFGYNKTSGGQANGEKREVYIYSDEIKQKMSKKAIDNWKDEDYRKKILKFQLEGKLTEEGRKNRSEATKNMWKNGKFEEHRKKLSETMLGVPKSDETKIKMKNASFLREQKHKEDYNIYVESGGNLNFREFCKHYNKGVNDLLNGN